MVSVAGLILAAGKSQRMGRSKLMLDYQGKTFLEHLYEEARDSALSAVKIVLGPNAEQIQLRFPDLAGKWIVNPDYERGQIFSIQCGLRGVMQDSHDGVMLLLIDHPLVDRQLINQLIDSFKETHRPIILPSYGHRRGHPVLFSKALFEELLSASLDQGASAVVRRHENEIFHVAVGNPGVLVDIDTPEDYERSVLQGKAKKDRGGIS
jgi:molybdenum cofactor cytidylyltransferase